jgi:hypothetical protein
MYERRLFGCEQRLVRVNALGEMQRTASSGSQVLLLCGIVACSRILRAVFESVAGAAADARITGLPRAPGL